MMTIMIRMTCFSGLFKIYNYLLFLCRSETNQTNLVCFPSWYVLIRTSWTARFITSGFMVEDLSNFRFNDRNWATNRLRFYNRFFYSLRKFLLLVSKLFNNVYWTVWKRQKAIVHGYVKRMGHLSCDLYSIYEFCSFKFILAVETFCDVKAAY